jgi:hypothetical protein
MSESLHPSIALFLARSKSIDENASVPLLSGKIVKLSSKFWRLWKFCQNNHRIIYNDAPKTKPKTGIKKAASGKSSLFDWDTVPPRRVGGSTVDINMISFVLKPG